MDEDVPMEEAETVPDEAGVEEGIVDQEADLGIDPSEAEADPALVE
jgi:hypothetical protein